MKKTKFIIWGIVCLALIVFVRNVTKKPTLLAGAQKISELTSYTAPISGDVLPINDTTSVATKQITVNNLFNILSTLFRIKDSSDTTKKAAFSVSNITTATTRTFTLPDLDLTLLGYDTTGSTSVAKISSTYSTSTNATSTSLFATTASTTNFFGAGLKGAGCSGVQFLQWSAGSFSCGSTSGGVASFSTTTLQNMATTTIRSNELPSGNRLRITFYTPSIFGSASTSQQASVYIGFNSALDTTPGQLYLGHRLDGTTQKNEAQGNFSLIDGPSSGFLSARPLTQDYSVGANIEISNASSASPHRVSYDATRFATTTVGIDTTHPDLGEFTWATTTAAISTIEIYTGGAVDQASFATGTVITLEGY